MTLLERLKKILQSNKRVVIFTAIITPIFVFGNKVYESLPSKVIISQDVSLDNRLWFVKPYDGTPLKNGDYVIFKIFFNFKNKWDPEKDTFLKQVACVPGQYLEIKDLKVYCDGIYLGDIRTTDSQGDPIDHFEYKGKIPEDKYFVMGTHEKSFDSRYWGFVDKKLIIKRAYPIW